MICPNCGAQNSEGYQFCAKCGMPLQAGAQTGINQYPPPVMPMMEPPRKKTFTWGDISTIVGFVCSVIGLFWYWLILCPIGLVASIYGFVNDKSKKLAIAGLVISIVAILIKIGYILYTKNMIPAWLSDGVL